MIYTKIFPRWNFDIDLNFRSCVIIPKYYQYVRKSLEKRDIIGNVLEIEAHSIFFLFLALQLAELKTKTYNEL